MKAAPARVSHRIDVPVGGCFASVIVAEGCPQIVWSRHAPAQLAGSCLFNDFITPNTGDQLRALARAIDDALAHKPA